MATIVYLTVARWSLPLLDGCELPDLDVSWSWRHWVLLLVHYKLLLVALKISELWVEHITRRRSITPLMSILCCFYLYCHLRDRNTLNNGTALSPWNRLYKRVLCHCHCFICQQTDHLIKTDSKVTVRFFWGGSQPNKMSLMMIINVVSCVLFISLKKVCEKLQTLTPNPTFSAVMFQQCR